ncbi:MAG: adenylate kinase [Dehalococcoidales bacterium]|jgi:adenylate kinase|nr:adenylate kinase [Dehalococcoidales bacterium]MDD3994227.1 adenylate kinase [Dehalococcoidales bacterium]
MYIIFLGAPGAGKGTQAIGVAKEFGLISIATGDLFRQAVERGDDLGKKVKEYMEKGTLVPNEITVQMVLNKLSEPESQNGVILDGFPRNLGQAEALDEAFEKENKKIDSVVYIKVEEQELIRRLSGRWVCRSCQSPYSIQGALTEEQKKCSKCGGELYQRPDDNLETIKNRLKVYFNETAPLIEYYRNTGRLVEVDGEGEVGEITQRIIKALREKA